MEEGATMAQLMGELNRLREQLQTKTDDVIRLEKENQELKASSADPTMEYDNKTYV